MRGENSLFYLALLREKKTQNPAETKIDRSGSNFTIKTEDYDIFGFFSFSALSDCDEITTGPAQRKI
jgi:hypothetical protein